jgi:hypothetical protein
MRGLVPGGPAAPFSRSLATLANMRFKQTALAMMASKSWGHHVTWFIPLIENNSLSSAPVTCLKPNRTIAKTGITLALTQALRIEYREMVSHE